MFVDNSKACLVDAFVYHFKELVIPSLFLREISHVFAPIVFIFVRLNREY